MLRTLLPGIGLDSYITGFRLGTSMGAKKVPEPEWMIGEEGYQLKVEMETLCSARANLPGP
jgi:hypothetical protein